MLRAADELYGLLLKHDVRGEIMLSAAIGFVIAVPECNVGGCK